MVADGLRCGVKSNITQKGDVPMLLGTIASLAATAFLAVLEASPGGLRFESFDTAQNDACTFPKGVIQAACLLVNFDKSASRSRISLTGTSLLISGLLLIYNQFLYVQLHTFQLAAHEESWS